MRQATRLLHRHLNRPSKRWIGKCCNCPKSSAIAGRWPTRPENTLASFREARRRGATWVEIDVKLTADGVPIVMHDTSLERTMGVDRLVAETPRAELPAEVPTFEQAIDCFLELGLGCNVEIKPCEGREAETARVTVETLRRCWPAALPAPLLSSFKDASLMAARAGCAGIRAGAADRRAGRRLARPGRGGRRRRASTNGKQLTAPGAVEISKAGYALSV